MATSSKPRTLFRPVTPTARHLKVLLHGTYGTGKTCAALSFPPPIALLDLEGGTHKVGTRNAESLPSGPFRVPTSGFRLWQTR